MKCMARTFIFCLCLFTADASMALSWLVESVPQAAAQGGRAFGKAQLKMVEQVRRAITQNPTWALSKDFTQTLNLLRKAGVVLPLQPIPSASTAAKETYLNITCTSSGTVTLNGIEIVCNGETVTVS